MATVVIVAVVMLAAGLYAGKTVLGSTSASSKPFVVGTNVPFPPFEDYNVTTKQYFGFDIQFAAMIAAAEHRPLLITNYADFGALLIDAGAGVFDMAASSITESGGVGTGRNLTMSFSTPYYEANQALLVKDSSSITCLASGCTVAVMAPLKIGLQSGTSSEDWANASLKGNETGSGSVSEFQSVDTEVAALEAGALDAVIIDTGPAAAIAAGSNGVLRVAGVIHTGELYGFAVAHGDPNNYIPTINGVIYTAIHNGTYQRLLTYWGLG
ncbi:MAG: ABC transporter substrate-binding protein [Thermoplasmata archaeon]